MKRSTYVLGGVLILVGLITTLAGADSINLNAGRVSLAELVTEGISSRWTGLIIHHDGSDLGLGTDPFANYTPTSSGIEEIDWPGANFKDGLHYYAATVSSTFNLTRVMNASESDLQKNGMFNGGDYPVFYPSYDNYTENPWRTFCCNQTNITIGGINYTGFVTELNESIPYYVLKYNNSGTMTPLFLTEIADGLCYNGTSCQGLFMLPVNTTYGIYGLSKTTSYDITTWVDGIETDIFTTVALPYNLTIEVRNTFTDVQVPNQSVVLYEEFGHNVFIPLDLSGILHTAYTVTTTSPFNESGDGDPGGEATFIAVPTGYQADENYSINVAVLEGGSPVSPKNLTVQNLEPLPTQRKSFSSTPLNNQAKAAINTLVSFTDFLFEWSSNLEAAKRWNLTYDIATGNWSYTSQHDPGGPLTLKAGAPNLLRVDLVNGGVPQSGSVKVEELDGHLVMSPYVADSPLPQTTRQNFETVPTGTWFTIAPTSTSVYPSNVTLEIYNAGSTLLSTTNININDSVNINLGSGVVSNNDLDLKSKVNSMVSVTDSLFYAFDT